MDWTWRLDAVVPLAVELAAILGGVLALLALLAGGLSLLGRRAVRAALQLALALALGELVPGYLPSVPRANWTILGHFVYEPKRRALSFLAPWPFERTYFFTTGEWDGHRLFGADDEDGARGRGQNASKDRAA